LDEGRENVSWMEECLLCPRDGHQVRMIGSSLVCSSGHQYRCFDGIPVMVVDELPPTQPRHWASADQIEAALSYGLDHPRRPSYVHAVGRNRCD
jgi:uncharacterized protein YbaR (Trm112 family)